MSITDRPLLAIEGGKPAITHPLPPMYPGGMRIGEEEEAAVLEVLRTKRLFRYYGPQPGPSKVEELEKAFASHVGSKYCLAVTSGTAALMVGLIGLGIGPGDEVIVPAYTWIASASSVVAVGAVPIVAEVDASLTLDPEDVERKISPYTRAIIPVHMRGAPCRMDRLMEIARGHQLKVLEDTAQANGASFHGQPLGTFGDAGIYSLQFNKILTSGEGGLLVTNDEGVYQRAVMAHDVVGGQRNHIPQDQVILGINFRMPELLAAVMLVQLKRHEKLLLDMRQRKSMLKESIAGVAKEKGVEFRVIHDPAGDASVSLVFLMPDAALAHKVARSLNAEGASAGVLYSPDNEDYHVYAHWTPIMNQRGFTKDSGPWRSHPRPIKYSQDMCPKSLALLGRSVAMEVSPELDNTMVEELAEALNKVLGSI